MSAVSTAQPYPANSLGGCPKKTHGTLKPLGDILFFLILATYEQSFLHPQPKFGPSRLNRHRRLFDDRSLHLCGSIYDSAECARHWPLCAPCIFVCLDPSNFCCAGLLHFSLCHAQSGRFLPLCQQSPTPFLGLCRELFPMVWLVHRHRRDCLRGDSLF